MTDAEREVIIEVLCSQALADDLGDVRDAESKLWDLIEVPDLPSEHPDRYSDSPFQVAHARLRAAGLQLPEYLRDDDEGEEQ